MEPGRPQLGTGLLYSFKDIHESKTFNKPWLDCEIISTGMCMCIHSEGMRGGGGGFGEEQMGTSQGVFSSTHSVGRFATDPKINIYLSDVTTSCVQFLHIL